MSKDVEIKNVAKLISEIIKLHNNKNTVLWFRGQRDAKWDLEPKVYRDKNRTRKFETSLSNRFRAQAGSRHPNTPKYHEYGLWLSLMQHYGLPTRLLDWSRSPLVAAYFAIEAQIYDPPSDLTDAAIWILEPHNLNRNEKGVGYVPAIETGEVLSLIKPAFDGEAPEEDKVFCAMASEYDLRMFVQQGCFTIHSSSYALNLRDQSENCLTKFVIPSSSIKSFAKEVEVCGLRKADIFPDLQNLSAELMAKPFG